MKKRGTARDERCRWRLAPTPCPHRATYSGEASHAHAASKAREKIQPREADGADVFESSAPSSDCAPGLVEDEESEDAAGLLAATGRAARPSSIELEDSAPAAPGSFAVGAITSVPSEEGAGLGSEALGFVFTCEGVSKSGRELQPTELPKNRQPRT